MEINPSKAQIAAFKKRTKEHIKRVQKNLAYLAKVTDLDAKKLKEIGKNHDYTKFLPEMVKPYSFITEYYKCLKEGKTLERPPEVKKATKYHVYTEKHHPEAHEDMNDMDDYCLAEMVCDWHAMSQELSGDTKSWVDANIDVKWDDKFNDEIKVKIYNFVKLLQNQDTTMIKSLIDKLNKGGVGSGKKGHKTFKDYEGAIPRDHAHYKEMVDHVNKLAQKEGNHALAYDMYHKHLASTARVGEKDGVDAKVKVKPAVKQDKPLSKLDPSTQKKSPELDPKLHIGATTSGKPIPTHAKDTANFSAEDHKDAMNAHYHHVEAIRKKVEDFKSKNKDKPVPQAVMDTLFHHMDQVKIHQQWTGKLTKAENMMDHGGVTIETSDFIKEHDSAVKCKWFKLIHDLMKDYIYGDEPRSITLFGDNVLHLVKVDEGLYSGYVTREGDEPETINNAKIEKMTIPTMIAYLKAMELIVDESIEIDPRLSNAPADLEALNDKLEAQIVPSKPLSDKIKILELIDKIISA